MSKIAPLAPCPCGSGAPYKACCQPYHKGQPAPTPEALMRSRFSAYAAHETDYIIATTHPKSRYQQADKKAWRKELRHYVETTQFLALNVREAHQDDAQGVGEVFFSAILAQQGASSVFTERSRFEKLGGRWLYLDGDVQR